MSRVMDPTMMIRWGIDLNKDEPSRGYPIKEAPKGGNLLHLYDGVGKWGNPPKIGGGISILRELRYDGGVTILVNLK